MKTILFSLVMVFGVLAFKGYSQIKVYNDNRVKIFGDRPTDDQNKDLSLQVYGKFGAYLTNGRIGFGEYNNGMPPFDPNKVFVGEAGSNLDTDYLELCGSKGVYLTWGQGYGHNNIIAKLDQEYTIINDVWTNVSSFKFNTDVYAHGLIINSDRRFKEDINPIGKASQKLKKLRPVSYHLKPEKAITVPVDFIAETEKEIRDKQELTLTKLKVKNLEKKRFGFVAQDLMEILPELVEEGEDGYYVDYLGMIPLLVETIKEQQQVLATLQTLLKS